MSTMKPIKELIAEPSRRVLVLDPSYPKNHDMRLRFVDSQFVKLMPSVTHFAEADDIEPKEESIYEEHGYRDRNEYFNYLSEEYDVDLDMVYTLADILGPDEEFDGLVTNLEDGDF